MTTDNRGSFALMGAQSIATLPPSLAVEAPVLGELAARVEGYLTSAGDGISAVVWLRRHRRKVVVEFDSGGGRCVGKAFSTDRGARTFHLQSELWRSGFCPPSPFTVARPLAYVADLGFFIQEKAPGRPLAEILWGEHGARKETAVDALRLAAGWLAAVQGVPFAAPPRTEYIRAAMNRYGQELAESLPEQAGRVERLTAGALDGLEASQMSPLVPSHGDLHPQNVFFTQEGRVTAIDLDTFGAQEPAADVAYLLAQLAIMGYWRGGCFGATSGPRECFWHACLDQPLKISADRVAFYMGLAFLQSLHYELCVFRNGKLGIIEPWLATAERCLWKGEMTLIDND